MKFGSWKFHKRQGWYIPRQIQLEKLDYKATADARIKKTMNKMAHIENIATVIVTALLVVALYYFSRSWGCLWGLLLLVNINTPKEKKNGHQGN